MNQFNYLGAWLQCLLQLAPPTGLVHVGAGGGNARQYPFADMPSLFLIEADARQALRLRSQLQGHASCQVVEAVLASEAGEAAYYSQSLANEDGLCPPSALQALWPNIETVQVGKRLTATLLGQMSLFENAKVFNWAMIDCLPSGEVLRGAGHLPSQWDVLVLRAMRDAPAGEDRQAIGLPAICLYLAAYGLKFVAMEGENHPQVVRAVFVRNQREQPILDKSKLIAENVDLTRANADLGAQRDAEAQAKSVLLAQRDALASDKVALTAALKLENDQLTEERQRRIVDKAELVRTVAEHSAQREALANDKVSLTAALKLENDQLTEERQRRIADKAELVRTVAEQSAQHDALVKDIAGLTVALDEQTHLAANRLQSLTTQQHDVCAQQQRIQTLEADHQEDAMRQQMLQEELIKAEAQIELIKDLLLREPGL